VQEPAKHRRFDDFHAAPQAVGTIAIILVFSLAVGGIILFRPQSSQAFQNPTIKLDMLTTGTTYNDATNMMSVGTIDSCLVSATANTLTHNHPTHLVVQNVEDLVGWQVRLNYIGDRLRPINQNVTPFTDNATVQAVGFTNLPIDQTLGLHRDVTSAASIPPSAPGPQTALVGATYNGTEDFPLSPDTPPKSTPDDTSYSAPSGGVLSQLNLQVVGNQSGNTLTMDLDDAAPNPPGSVVVIFDGAGIATISLSESALGDGAHVEGGSSCGASSPTPPTQPPTPPSPTPTAPSPTPTAPPPTPTPTPTPPGVHDAGVSRVNGPTSVRLRFGVPDTSGRVTIVVANNSGDHADLIGVYLAFLPPGGTFNEGGCSPAVVQNLGAISLLPGDKLTVSTAPSWQCANPAAVDGATWTLKAIADAHADDFASCSTLQQVFSGQCSAALADDDNGTSSNSVIRARPKVVALSP